MTSRFRAGRGFGLCLIHPVSRALSTRRITRLFMFHHCVCGPAQPRTNRLSRVGFIVTTLTGTNRAVVRFYNQRGTAERWIKEGKEATHWTRLSCHRYRANEVRLLLRVIAYNLRSLLRRLDSPSPVPSRVGR